MDVGHTFLPQAQHKKVRRIHWTLVEIFIKITPAHLEDRKLEEFKM